MFQLWLFWVYDALEQLPAFAHWAVCQRTCVWLHTSNKQVWKLININLRNAWTTVPRKSCFVNIFWSTNTTESKFHDFSHFSLNLFCEVLEEKYLFNCFARWGTITFVYFNKENCYPKKISEKSVQSRSYKFQDSPDSLTLKIL